MVKLIKTYRSFLALPLLLWIGRLFSKRGSNVKAWIDLSRGKVARGAVKFRRMFDQWNHFPCVSVERGSRMCRGGICCSFPYPLVQIVLRVSVVLLQSVTPKYPASSMSPTWGHTIPAYISKHRREIALVELGPEGFVLVLSSSSSRLPGCS